MAWDSTKSTAADPDNPTADEQNPASEWNEMITYLKARVGNTLFDAYSILYADVDDTPAALTVAASRIIGRKATGGIAAMTAAELISLVGQWGDADTVDGCDAGWTHGDVFKLIDTGFVGAIYYSNATGIDYLNSATSGHILTTNGTGTAPTWEAPYSHPTARACTTGNWAWASISGKPSTYPPSAHNQSASTITSGTLPVARGGTGVTGDTYDADKVDGCHAGISPNNVLKLATGFDGGEIYYGHTGNYLGLLGGGTNGYQLTTHGVSANPTWAAASDLIFSDTHCPKCGKKFEDGDNLILHVIGHNEVGDILTIPMHQSCAAEPKKTVMIKRKVMEDQYVLDERTGEPKMQRVQKTQEKIITKHKMKEGYVLDNKSGKALKIDVDGRVGKTKHNLPDALETVEETITEVVYEDAEFEL